MLQNHATARDARNYLTGQISRIYDRREASSMATWIMEHAGISRPSQLADPLRKLSPGAVGQINEIVREIHTGRPLQYILGRVPFMDLELEVNEKVLIPRPETEEMVSHILRSQTDPPRRILDLGTGSGCIALALKAHFPEAEVTAIDIDSGALEVARLNGKRCGLEIRWLEGDMADKRFLEPLGRYDLVAGNPPYVTHSEKKEMEAHVLRFEPPAALYVTDDDPLVHYHSISSAGSFLVRRDGAVWLEINARFGERSAHLFREAGFSHVTVLQDIHGKERFLFARK